MIMPGRKFSAGGSYRYGFNGKEDDDDVKGDGNQQDYGMRIYDPRLGRFLSVDPITDEYPELTPYQFASNTPIQAIDIDGLEAFYIHVRSFISAATTRDPLLREFKGDNRSTTVAEDVTARGRVQINYDVGTRRAVISGTPLANETIRSNWGLSTSKKTGNVTYRTNQFDNGSNKVIDLLYSTYNPLTPKWLTPSVDVKARFLIGYDKNNHVLDVRTIVFADGYPSTEAFIEDQSKQRIFLGAKPEEGSPATRLNGGPELLRFKQNLKITLDKNQNFVSVTVDEGKESKTYSIQDWNKMVQTRFDNERKDD
jgi:RHS repeat-associated protein